MAPGESQADFLPLDIRQAVSAGQKPIEMPVKLDAFIDADVVNGQKVEGIGWQDDDLKLAAFDLTGMLIGVQLQPESRPSQKQEDIFTQAKELIENKREDLLEKAANTGDTPEIQSKLRELEEFEENIIAVVDRNLHPEKFVTEEKKDPAVELKRVLNSATEIAQLNDVLGKIQGAVDSTDKSRQLPALEIEKLLAKLEANLTKLELFIPSHGSNQDPATIETQRKVVIAFLDEKRTQIVTMRATILAEWQSRTDNEATVKRAMDVLDGRVAGKTIPEYLRIFDEADTFLVKLGETVPGLKDYNEYVAKLLMRVREEKGIRDRLIETWYSSLKTRPFVDSTGGRHTIDDVLKNVSPGGSLLSPSRANIEKLEKAISAFKDGAQQTDRINGSDVPWTAEQKKRWQTEVDKIESAYSALDKKNEFLSQVERLANEPAAVIEKQEDVVEKRLKPLYLKLEEVKAQFGAGSREFVELERRVWIADYVFTKRSLHQTLADNELNESNKDFYLDHGGYTAQYVGNGFDRLVRLSNKLSVIDGRQDAQTLSTLESDIALFKKNINYRRTFFFAGLYHKDGVIGSVVDGKSAAKIPAGPAPLFPDKEALLSSDRPSGKLPNSFVDGVPLRFAGEREFNPEGEKREDSLQDFENPGTYIPIPEFQPSQFGDAKRLLDMMFNNRLHIRLAEAVKAQNRPPAEKEKSLIALFEYYFKNQHLPEWNDQLNERISDASEIIYGYRIDKLTVKEAWYSHILKLNQAMLIPASSQFQDNQIYKANQALTYLMEAIQEVSTSGFDLFRVLMLIGIYTDTEDLDFWLSQVVNPEDLSEAKGVIQGIGNRIAGISSREGSRNGVSISEEIKSELLNSGLEQYEYLAELPLMETARTRWGTFPFLPLPMQFALFKDSSGRKYSKRASEIAVKRFGKNVPGRESKPVTAADYINENGDIMYELIPVEDQVEGTDLQTWFNNGPNFSNFYNLYASGVSADDLSYKNLSALFNQDKYAGAGLPGGWGEEVRCGRIDGKKASGTVGVVYVLGTCFSLLMSGKVKTFYDLESKLNEGFTKAVSPDATKAVMIILRKTLGSEAEARTYGEGLEKQLEGLLKFR